MRLDPFSTVLDQFHNEVGITRIMFAQWGWEIYDNYKHEVMFISDNDMADPYVIQRQYGASIARPHFDHGAITLSLPRNWSFAPKLRTYCVL